MSAAIAKSLQQSPALEELNIASTDAKDWLSSGISESAALQTIVQNLRLRVVSCRGQTAREQVNRLLQENHDSLRLDTVIFIFVD